MKTLAGRFTLIGGLLLLVFASITPLSAETETQPATDENGTQRAEPGSWLDNYLATQLHYDAEQIRQFKANIAEMQESDLKALVGRLKESRSYSSNLRKSRLEAHRRNVQQLAAAKSQARARPIRQAPYRYASHSHGALRRNPRSYGLFRGYVVFLGEIAR